MIYKTNKYKSRIRALKALDTLRARNVTILGLEYRNYKWIVSYVMEDIPVRSDAKR